MVLVRSTSLYLASYDYRSLFPCNCALALQVYVIELCQDASVWLGCRSLRVHARVFASKLRMGCSGVTVLRDFFNNHRATFSLFYTRSIHVPMERPLCRLQQPVRNLDWSRLGLYFGGVGVEFTIAQFEIEGYQWHWLKYLVSIYEYALAIFISIALFALSARYLDKNYSVVSVMAKSAYTVYVVHFILVAFLLLFLQRVGLSMDVRMVLSALLACGMGMAFHFLVVDKFRFASYLFNGRLQSTSSGVTTSTVEGAAK